MGEWADQWSAEQKTNIWGTVPSVIEMQSEGGAAGVPLVLSDPDSPAALALRKIADDLGARSRSLAGRNLGITPR